MTLKDVAHENKLSVSDKHVHGLSLLYTHQRPQRLHSPFSSGYVTFFERSSLTIFFEGGEYLTMWFITPQEYLMCGETWSRCRVLLQRSFTVYSVCLTTLKSMV